MEDLDRMERPECFTASECRYFPLFISLRDKRILIAGAGKIAARRAGILYSFGAGIVITAPECSAEMAELLKKQEKESGGNFVYRKKRFEESDLSGADLVLAATDDDALNHRIVQLCRERKLPVNNASCKGDCDFFFPAILQEDGLTIGVSSGGSDHKKVAEVCAKLRRFFRNGVHDEEG